MGVVVLPTAGFPEVWHTYTPITIVFGPLSEPFEVAWIGLGIYHLFLGPFHVNRLRGNSRRRDWIE